MKFLRDTLVNAEIVMILEIWEMLKGNSGGVRLEDLKVLMMGFMGYYQRWMEDGLTFSLDQRAVKKAHKEYKLLFHNRTALSSMYKCPVMISRKLHSSEH